MTTLKVEEMSCNHCVSRIDTALTEANIEHSICLENKTVDVEGEETTIQKAIEILDDLGFTAIK